MDNSEDRTEATDPAIKKHKHAGDWNEHYNRHGTQSGRGEPNGVLLAEIAGETPGRALDVGCGLGSDAIWLASQGWPVTAVDISQTALDYAASAALESAVTVEWVCADFVVEPTATGIYDLVSTHYPALRNSANDDAVKALVTRVAPGGTILVVGHAPDGDDYARSHGTKQPRSAQHDPTITNTVDT